MPMNEKISKSMYGMTDNVQTQDRFKKTLKFFENKLRPEMKILDVGNRNPLTDLLEDIFNVTIMSTTGDLDTDFEIPEGTYDVIIYSHTLEHQFNPLHSLLRLRDHMDQHSLMYLSLPDRGKLLWAKGHFHEIDAYRFGLLMERAGFEIVSKQRDKVWRSPKQYLLGVRPLLRLFWEYNVTYTVKLEPNTP